MLPPHLRLRQYRQKLGHEIQDPGGSVESDLAVAKEAVETGQASVAMSNSMIHHTKFSMSLPAANRLAVRCCLPRASKT